MARSRIPEINWASENHEEALQLFKQIMSYYCEDEDITDPGKIALKILKGIGNEGLKRLNASGMSDADKKRPDKIRELFESQLKTNLNFRVHRLHLMDYRQRSEESVDDFVTIERTQALKCEFEESELEERIIELMIASTPIETFQRELPGKAKGYKLTDALAEGRRFEAILAGRQEIHKRTSTPLNNVDQVGQACSNCGRAHPPRACPAYKDSCKFCGKIGHWKNFAENAKEQTVRKKMFNNVVTPNRMANNTGMLAKAAVGETEDSMIWSQQPVTLQRKPPLSPMTAYAYPVYAPRFLQHWMLSALGKRACARSNSRSILELRGTHSPLGHTSRCTRHSPLGHTSRCTRHSPSKKILEYTRNVKLVAYNGQEIPCLGSINLQLRFGKKKKNFTKAKFYVVHVPSAPLVGLPTCEKTGLVTIHCDDLRPKPDVTTVEGLKQAYPGQFDTLGDFRGVAKLHLKQDCEPFIDPPRKCSIHLKEKLKCGLKKMEKQGVIRKVSEHTDWCSSLAYSVKKKGGGGKKKKQKKKGSLRICIDPQKHNQALKRCPHKVPTLEELNPQFAGSKVFSKLDAKAGYWSVHLDPDSQYYYISDPVWSILLDQITI